jgi:hypothetical protein
VSASSRSLRPLALLCLAIAVLAGAASAIGVVFRGDGPSRTVTSVRGETYEIVTNGVYAWNAERVVAEGVGWDVVTLLLAVPALVVATPALARGSVRARVFAMGLLAYFFYQYLMYALTWAFGPLFLPFVAIYGASLVALAWLAGSLTSTDLEELATPSFPRRRMAALCLVMAVLLCGMWLQRIAVALHGDLSAAMLLGQTTLVVQALDLGLVVPLAVYTGIATWRSRPIGYLLSSIVVVKMVAMTVAICAMLLSAWVVEGALDLPALAIFATAAAASILLCVGMYAAPRPRAPALRHPPARPL